MEEDNDSAWSLAIGLITLAITAYGVWCALPLIPPVYYLIVFPSAVILFLVGGRISPPDGGWPCINLLLLIPSFIGAFLYGLWCIIFGSH